VQALRAAWDAAIEGIPLARHAERIPVLAQALDFWR
jgi:ribulose-bisphosphate carboxylase large chain